MLSKQYIEACLPYLDSLDKYINENYIDESNNLSIDDIIESFHEPSLHVLYSRKCYKARIKRTPNEKRVNPRKGTNNENLVCEVPTINGSLEDTINETDNNSITWQIQLFKYIDSKNLDDRIVYKNAQIDRKLFSKIKSDKFYHPSKDTVISFSFSLKLTLDETIYFLNTAGYSLSKSIRKDVITEYFFKNQLYDLDEYKYALYYYNELT